MAAVVSLDLTSVSSLRKSQFVSGSAHALLPACLPSVAKSSIKVRPFFSASNESYDHIPKQFGEENLKDGLMDNFKNTPKHFYGLSPSQMDMFKTEDNPINRQSQKVTEESIASARNYLDNGGMWSISGVQDCGPSKYSMSVSMYRGGARGYGRPRSAPPDLLSLLLDARICYLGMSIVPAVTELLVAQFMWLDYESFKAHLSVYKLFRNSE